MEKSMVSPSSRPALAAIAICVALTGCGRNYKPAKTLHEAEGYDISGTWSAANHPCSDANALMTFGPEGIVAGKIGQSMTTLTPAYTVEYADDVIIRYNDVDKNTSTPVSMVWHLVPKDKDHLYFDPNYYHDVKSEGLSIWKTVKLLTLERCDGKSISN